MREERGEERGEELRGRWKRDVRDCEKGFGRRQTERKKLGEELGKELEERLREGIRQKKRERCWGGMPERA